MNNQLRNEVSETILRRAIIDAFNQDMAEIESEPAEPYTFSEAHNARMRALFRREARREAMSKFYDKAKRAAIIVMLTISTLFGTLLTDANFRATVRDALITRYEQFTLFRFIGENYEVGDSDWLPSFIPYGFELIETVEFHIGRLIVWEHPNGNYIQFEYFSAEGAIVGVDNEYTEMSFIKLDGIEYFVITPLAGSEHSFQVLWLMNGYVFTLISSLDSEILLEIAISVAPIP
ncbi:MAG: DUF4367 domain-containing protein [Defluviitaleaceae bacterium]|nr:DUF4367 domain-containing protein [Defluviitaleaceae bacterium]